MSKVEVRLNGAWSLPVRRADDEGDRGRGHPAGNRTERKNEYPVLR
ncbi:MAG: hypothetical protein WA637_04540 [Terriglobales bacterium]